MRPKLEIYGIYIRTEGTCTCEGCVGQKYTTDPVVQKERGCHTVFMNTAIMFILSTPTKGKYQGTSRNSS